MTTPRRAAQERGAVDLTPLLPTNTRYITPPPPEPPPAPTWADIEDAYITAELARTRRRTAIQRLAAAYNLHHTNP